MARDPKGIRRAGALVERRREPRRNLPLGATTSGAVRKGRPAAVRKTREAPLKSPSGGETASLSQGRGGFHRRALRRSWRQFQDGSLSHWITTMVIALSLTIYGVFALLLSNANTALDAWQGDSLVSVFLAKGLSPDEAVALQGRIAHQAGVIAPRLISPGQALVRMKGMLGSEAGLLDELDENPLPHVVEFKMAGSDTVGAAARLAERIRHWPGVESVSYDRQWAERLAAMVHAFRYLGYALSALLLGAVALIISNTIKLTIIARREEVEVMRFMGATDAFIKTPFIYEGVLQGLLGALLGLLLITGLTVGAQGAVAELGRAFGLNLHLHHLPPGQLGMILSIGVLLGLTGALISVSRFLKV